MRLFPVVLGVVCVLSSVSALAGDFTGIYAGVNAGYGFGQERQRGFAPAASGGSGSPEIDRNLPPSAAAASQAMEAARTSTARSGRPSPQR